MFKCMISWETASNNWVKGFSQGSNPADTVPRRQESAACFVFCVCNQGRSNIISSKLSCFSCLCHVKISAVSSDDMKPFENFHLFHPESVKKCILIPACQTDTNRKSCPTFGGEPESSMMKHTENAVPHSPRRRDQHRFAAAVDRVLDRSSLKIKES